MMMRRDFITLLGGAAAAWPLAARAQQPAMPTVGLVNAGSPESAAYRTSAFRQGLDETRYAEARHGAIEYHWAEGHNDRIPEIMTNLVRRPMAFIETPTEISAALGARTRGATI